MGTLGTPSVKPLADAAVGAGTSATTITLLLLKVQRFARILAFSVAFDVALSVLALVGLNVLHDQSQVQQSQTKTIASLASNQHQRCLAGNVYRARDQQLWNHLLGLQPTVHQTPAQVAAAAAFRTYIDKLDAPVKCT